MHRCVAVCFTPATFSAAASSTLFTAPPYTGECSTDAYSIPSICMSCPYTALPRHHVLQVVSSARASRCTRQSFRGFSCNSSFFGTGSFAAAAASSP